MTSQGVMELFRSALRRDESRQFKESQADDELDRAEGRADRDPERIKRTNGFDPYNSEG